MQYTIYATQDFMGDWTGEFPDLPGCAPEGGDMEEFLANVQAAVEEWAAENGVTALPQPGDFVTVRITHADTYDLRGVMTGA